MRKKYWVFITVVLAVLALAVAGCGGGSQPAQEKPKAESPAPAQQGGGAQPASAETYKIGAIYDVTGPGSSLGLPERNTAQWLVDQVNAKGGINGHKVELALADNESDETKSLLAFKKLISEDKVPVVVGPSQTGTTMSLVDTANKEQVPLISAAAGAVIVNPVAERKWVFKTAQNDSVVATKLIGYLKQKGFKKVGFMSVNNGYGDSGLKEFTAVAQKEGLEIVAQEKFEATDKDMTAQITKVRRANPDAVVVWAIPPAASIVTKNYRDLGMKQPLFHSHGIGNQDFIKLAGDAANGVIFPIGRLLVAESLPDNHPQKKLLVEYATAYEKQYGPRSTFGGHAYDGIAIAIEALKAVGPDRAKIRDYVENLKNFPGVTGIFNFSAEDHSGLDTSALEMVKIENGRWKLAE